MKQAAHNISANNGQLIREENRNQPKDMIIKPDDEQGGDTMNPRGPTPFSPYVHMNATTLLINRSPSPISHMIFSHEGNEFLIIKSWDLNST